MKKDTAQSILKLAEDEYDAFAREFSDSRAFFWKELEFLQEHVKPNQSVLDIGCGNGRLLNLFEGTPLDYTGIDSSNELIKIARKNHGDQGVFIHGNALALPFEDNSFDVVFSIAVIHHIPSKGFRKQFVDEAYRVLKPGGTMIITTWNIRRWQFFRERFTHTVKKIFGLSKFDFGDVILTFGKKKNQRYIHAFTKAEFGHLIKGAGFTISSLKRVERKSGYSNFVAIATKK
jgi:ubiquinone/menaquinone biosynthesis C-methylase UbiE